MKKHLAALGAFGVIMLTPAVAFAAEAPPIGLEENQDAFDDAGLAVNEPTEFIANIIRWVLGIIGILLVVVFVYAGVLYATSFGNSTRSDDAKKMMLYAIVGALITFAAFVASDLIISAIMGGGGQ